MLHRIYDVVPSTDIRASRAREGAERSRTEGD